MRGKNIRAAQIVRRFAFEEWGGTENVVWHSAQALLKFGVDSEIVTTKACSPTGNEVRSGLKILRFPYFYPYFPLDTATRITLDKKGGNPIAFALRRHLLETEFDLYHTHTAGRIAQMTREAALKRGKPYIVSFHGGCLDVPKAEIDAMLSCVKGRFHYGGILDRLYPWKKDFIRDAAGIICVGENEWELFRERYPKKKIIYLPNGVDAGRFDSAPMVDVKKEYGIPPERKLLLCVSRIDYQKNQKLLLTVLRILLEKGENAHLLLIGPVTAPVYYEEFKREREALNLSGHVTVIEGLPQDSEILRSAYLESEQFFLPSLHEPFGIVALEAWSAGLPLAASRVGGLARLVSDGEDALLASPENAQGFADAYFRFKDPLFRAKLVEAGRRKSLLHTWEKIAERLANFYDEILSEC